MQDMLWWKRGTVYQIYPRSFQDSNDDGIGDLAGIRERLPYLTWLGVDAIWISPFYPSPMADFGYDVADYCGVDPMFGSLSDFDALLADAHEAGLKVILDFVPNHTSDRHPWFAESRSDRASPKRDWYIWKDPAPGGGPPNNWISNFGGSAWQFDEITGQYYYHAFLKEQPDLNWRNPDVRAAMMDVLRFWLERGVDGFRVDVIWHLIKDAGFRDNPVNPGWSENDPEIGRLVQAYSADQPEVHEIIAEMRAVLEEYDERVLIGEIYLPLERLVAYYGEDLSGAHLPFNFQLLETAWHARQIDGMIREYEAALPQGGWPNWVLGNHDRQRIAGRVGTEQARVAAMLLLTLRGTATLYYGDEIGMQNVPIPPDRVQDPWEKNEPGLGFNRDAYRTPMQWDASEGAGFTTAEPWLPIDMREPERNVADERQDEGSMLCLYRRLLDLRRTRPALAVGAYRPVEAEGDVLAYCREEGTERLLVALNLGAEPAALSLPPEARGGRIVLSVLGNREAESVGEVLSLQGNEAVLLEFSA
ncbi:alpha-amylase family glycosyl hydrolase [Afifella sp. IM 167]|uniref:alpha-amylase family glycosyl hydrolase n=1 Tax=Afifella sp. IM 167 TaxID=2033586 RepID=UPI001CCE2954|nr:alpha-amylase family glycosyl hydrolase [Afifella sp. IM 167]MBZ8132311.1 alpha-amylase [Afifella sp. IM 167]